MDSFKQNTDNDDDDLLGNNCQCIIRKWNIKWRTNFRVI
jgi:hypothetical protein